MGAAPGRDCRAGVGIGQGGGDVGCCIGRWDVGCADEMGQGDEADGKDFSATWSGKWKMILQSVAVPLI